MADYRIELGVHVRTNEIRKQISAYNTNSNNAKLQLGVKLNTADLKKQIQSLNVSGGTKGLLSIDTKTLEASLNRVAGDIKEIRAAFGTLDGKSNMNNLLTSINQISSALDRASKQFVELNTQLNSLSGKNFGVNIGLSMGSGNAVSRNAAYGSIARGEIIPQLQQQVSALESYLARYYKVADGINGVNKLIQGTSIVTAANHPMTLLPQMADGSNLSRQMGALKQYIALIKEAAAVKGVDLTPVTSGFTQSADQLVTKAQNVQSGTAQMQESFKQLQGLFSSGINAEKLSAQLDSIVADLSEIRTALQGLSQNASLSELTTSFNNLSASLEKLVGNATQAQNVLNNGLNTSGASAGTKKAIQEQNQLAQATTQAANAVSQSGQKVQQAFNQMASASNLDPVNLRDDISETDEMAAAVTRLKQVMSGIGKLQTGQLGTAKSVQELQVLETQLESLSAEWNETVAEINSMGGMGLPQMQQLRGQMETTARTIEQLKAKLTSGIKGNFGNYETELIKLNTRFNQLTNQTPELKTQLESVKQVLASLKSADSTEALLASNRQYLSLIEQIKSQLLQLEAIEKGQDDTIAVQQAKQAAMSKLHSGLESGSAAAKKFSGEIQTLEARINACDNISGFKSINKDIGILRAKIKQAGVETQTFGSQLKSQLSKYSVYFSGMMMFTYAIQGLRSMFEQVKLIDSAMTELKKVTDETDESYNQFLSNAATRSREIGTTIDGLVSSTADFARLGYGFKDAQGLAEVANIYAVVGDEIEGVEQATESLISTMAAFKDSAGDMSNSDFAMSIIDKFNEIGNNFAISSGGIGEALERSASSLDAANNTIDESIALITAANTVVQDPEQVGTAFKTISMRIRGAKTELEEAGLETDGMVESTAKLREEILALTGVDIMDGANQFKSTYAIMDELAAKWQDLTDIQQASVTELIAGKRQGNIVSSLMTNFDTAREALETSLNSSGSAMKEHEKWQKSLEAQINKLKASWQSLSQAFLKSDFLHDVLNGVIGLADGLTALIDKFGTLPTLIGAFAGFKGITKWLPAIFATINATGGMSGIKGLRDVIAALSLTFPNAAAGAKTFGGAIKAMFTAMTAHPIILVITAALAVLVKVFTDQSKKAEELAEKVDELTDKYKEQHDELKKLQSDYDTSNESSMISRYEKLSKGVDNLGRNVSLTSEEYSEYQSIVNSIADQIPSLVSGYDEQGNALLSVKGNVEALTEAYQKLIHAQNQKVLSNTGDIEKNFKNKLDDVGDISFWEQLGQSIPIYNWFTDPEELPTDVVKKLEKALENPDLIKGNWLDSGWDGWDRDSLRKSLKDAGVDVKWYQDELTALRETLKNDPAKIRSIVDNHYAQFAEIVEQQKTVAQAVLSEAFDVSSVISGLNYNNIGEDLQAIANQVVSSLDYDFFAKLSESGKSVEQWTKEMLNQLNSIGKADNAQIEAGFDLQTQFNGGEISYGEYVANLRDLEKTIDGLNLKDEAKTQLKISLGLDENGIVDQYDALVKRLTSKEIGLDDKVARNFLDNLSTEELSVLVDIIPQLDAGTTIDEIKSIIGEKLAEKFKFDITLQTEGIEAFNNALAESRSAAGLTTESIAALKARYEDLDGFNATALFEKTANGIHLNNEELSRLEEQYISTNKLDIDKNLNKLVTKYNDLTEEIKNCTDAQEKENLQFQANTYKDKIDELSTLASQYNGLTSAFAKWQTALEGAEEGDNYDSLYENLEGIKELYDKGLVGTDKFKTAVQLMTNKDLANADIDEIVSAYKKGYPKMQRYFTEGQKGCKNFLNDVRNLNSEWAHMNKDGSWEINFNAEEVAKELGVSVDFVLQIAKKLKDYGFEVNLEDSSVDNLKTKIEQTEAKLKELGQAPVDINVDIEANAGNLGTIEAEIEKAKSKIAEINNSSVEPKVKTAQLEDAQAKLEALIDKKIEASQPAFMNLNTSQVNASLVDALEKVQSYQDAINEVNKLSELKEAGITIDDSQLQKAKEKVDECAKAIQGLDGEVKMAIGLEEDGSVDSIKKAFEEGKVKIDANTDPALTKIEQLAENVERIEDKDVTINVTVNGLDKVKELNKQIDLATDIDGDIDKLSKYVESAKALSGLGDNITTYVTAEINGNVTKTKEKNIKKLKTFAENVEGLKGVGSFTTSVKADVSGNVIDTKENKIDNLKVFTDSAKDVEKIGTVQSTVTADIKGNVANTKEYKLDNLKVFTDNAKDINKIGVVESKVKADIEGNVINTREGKLDNLKVFTDNAKDIRSIGNVESKVSANIDGNVVDTREGKIDNLKVFTDNAKDISKIGNVESSVDANINGNVIDTREGKLDNLKVFTDNAKDIAKIGDAKSTVTAEIKGNVIDTREGKLDNIKVFTDSAKDIRSIGNVSSKVTAEVDGNVIDTKERKLDNIKVFTDSAKDLKSIGTIKSSVNADIGGNVIDTREGKLDNLEVFAKGAKEIKNIGTVTSDVAANIDGNVISTREGKLDNLGVFADNVKDLKNIGSFKSEVTANIDGNVVDTKERKIDNLKVFYDSVKNLKNIGDVNSTVKVNVEGNVINTKERKIDNLEVFSDSAKDLKNIGDVTSKVSANVDGNVISTREGKLDNLKVYYDSAKNISKIGTVTSKVDANVYGNVIDTREGKIDNLKVFSDNAKEIKNIGSPTSNVTANVYGNVISTRENKIDNLGVFATNANKLKNTGNFTSSVSANVSGNVIDKNNVNSRLERFASIVSGMSNKTVTVSVTANVDAENVNKAIDILTDVSKSKVFKNYKATVQVGAKIATIDDTTVKNYKAPPKDGKVAYSVDPNSSVYTWTAPSKDGVVNYSAEVEALTNGQKHKTGTITYTPKIKGFPVVNGTANANGSAFANGTSGRAYRQGDWGVKQTTTALTGELGQELVVYGNRYWTVGDNGAEFATIPKGAIVFNHKQTAELFKNGRVTSDGGRGRAFVEGTAFNNVGAKGKFYNSSTGESYGSNDKNKETDKDFEEVLDWIEVIIDRVERSIDKFDQQANNIYKSWSSRNTALQNQISEVNREIGLQQQAKSKYMSAANGVGLSESWAKKVRNGEIDIDTIKDETLAEKIKSYQDYYNKVLDCEDAIRELREQESKLYAQCFENVQAQYDGILQGYEHTESMLNEYISQAEAQGHIVSTKYYDALINNEKQNINTLKQEQAALIAERDKAVADGKITKYSEEWYNMCAEIDGVTQAIEEGTTALIEYDNAIRDIDWQVFDLIQERISDITAESEFLIELMSNKNLFDDKGKLTEQGAATIGLHALNYNTSMYQADDYGKEIAEIDKQIAKDPYDQELINRRRELIEIQRESILEAENQKNAIKDLVEEGINLELDALQERIDLHNEELDSMKDLYDYQKNVEEQTKNIASLRKQLAAYEGFDNEETRAKVQELKVSLEEAEADLFETEYDKFINDQTVLLDNLFLEYENVLNTRIDDTNLLIQQVIDGINASMGAEGIIDTALGSEGAIAKALGTSASTIGETLKTEVGNVGTKLSTAMSNIWLNDGSGKAILDMYGKDFQAKHTTTNTALNQIKTDVGNMVDDVDKDAQKKVADNKTQPSTKADPTKNTGSNNNKPTSNANKSSGDGKAKVGDKVKFVSGKYYYDSQGKQPLGSKYQGKEVYITSINTKKWATHPYHISTGKTLGSGDLGWLKLNQLSGYATGKKKISNGQYAWTQENGQEYIVRPSDGAILTPVAKGDSVLNATATGNIWSMANNPAEFIKDNLKLDTTSVPNGANVQSNLTQHFENITFSMPNVHSYSEMVSEMQRDPKFEKLIHAMTIDQIAGKSKLGKNKAIR